MTREEAIKHLKCILQCYVDGCNEKCDKCEWGRNVSSQRAYEIALKHIQGYKNVIKWLNEEKIEATRNGNYNLKNHLETFERAMKEEFDISEVE